MDIKKLHNNLVTRYRNSIYYKFRLLRWIVGKLYFSTVRPVLTAAIGAKARTLGWKFSKNSDLDLMLEIMHQQYEKEIVAFCQRHVKDGMYVIDVGAHVGYFARLTSELVGSNGKVYAFEPNRANYDCLSSNIRHSRYPNIIAVNKAVAHRDGKMTFYESDQATTAHSLLFNPGRTTLPSEVEAITLDTFVRQQGLSHVDLIKVDAEGGEPQILLGMTELIKNNQDLMLICEYCPGLLLAGAVEPAQFLAQLNSLGFKVCVIGRNGQLVEQELISNTLVGYGSVNLFCTQEA